MRDMIPNSSRRSVIARLLLCTVLAVALAPAAIGAIVIDLPDITVFGDNVVPTSGTLEVALSLTGADLATPPPASSFNLDFSTDGSGLSFAAAQPATTSPLFTGGFFGDYGTSTNVRALHEIIPSSVPMFNGAGLLKIPFTIAAGNIGTTYHLNFGPLNEFTYTSGTTVTTYPLTLIGGSISVTSVPEVVGWKQLVVATSLCGLGFVVVKLRRRTALA